MRNECFSDGYFEGQRWATTWTETHGTEYGNAFVEGIKFTLNEVTLGYAVDVPAWNEGFVYGARQIARDFVRYGIVAGNAAEQLEDECEGEDAASDNQVADDSQPSEDGERLPRSPKTSRLAA